MLSESKINRRNLIFGKSKSTQRTVSLSLEPYSQPLTEFQVFHLLRRTNFGISYAFAKSLIGKTANDVVELLLNNATIPIQPQLPSWVDTGFASPFELKNGVEKSAAIQKFVDTIASQNHDLKIWWINLIKADSQSIREKMTLFWHGHFVSQLTIPAQLMYRQNKLFREMHQGNFRSFLQKITLDGAMLIYLNGQDNSKTAPNENYARELLELFTMGIGNYDEFDIQMIAKVLTGWRTNFYTDNQSAFGLFKTYLDLGQHNIDDKYFFYEMLYTKFELTQDNVLKNELDVLIDRILTLRTKQVAAFMVKKFYRFFVYSSTAAIDQTIVDGLSATFTNSGFQIRPVIAQLLKSNHFFDESNIGVQIKTPVETILGFARQFPVDVNFQESMMTQMGQELLNPPNVAGWKGYRNWVTTTTLPFVVSSLSNLIDNQSNESMANWAKQFPNYQSSTNLTSNILNIFHPKTADSTKIAQYEQKLLGGTPNYEWLSITANDAVAGQKIKVLMKEIIKAAEFYLC